MLSRYVFGPHNLVCGDGPVVALNGGDRRQQTGPLLREDLPPLGHARSPEFVESPEDSHLRALRSRPAESYMPAGCELRRALGQ